MQSHVPSAFTLLSDALTWVGTSLARTRLGFARDVWRIVPPVRVTVRTRSAVSCQVQRSNDVSSSGSRFSRLIQPRRRPNTSTPCSSARITAALMTTFRPGTSPPPVNTPTRRVAMES